MTDYSSHTFTTLSQTLHRIFQQVSTHLQHIFIMRQQTLQQVSTRWMIIDFLLQLIQQTLHQHSFTFISTNHDTILYQHSFQQIMIQFFINIHFNKSWYNSLSTFITNIHNRRVGYRSFIAYFNEYFITSSLHTSSQTFTIGELVIDHSLHTSTNTSSWLSDRSSTNLSQQHIQMVIHYIHSTNSSSIFIISLSQNSHNNLWYNSSLYIFQRTSVSFVNVRIVHTSYHKTFITLQQTMKQFFITKLSKQSSLVSHINFIMLISSC